ncbi:hypothetical protein IWQ62_005380 [Dispira parvispora]|uniref:Uncharacterized protein n=1 Tax=Dispira parvispora TaxID=1520584 RepID=A0A9W8E132_9FUNG|nr:hypothetical protein IWQ62_005380 [Dispira parvispora]
MEKQSVPTPTSPPNTPQRERTPPPVGQSPTFVHRLYQLPLVHDTLHQLYSAASAPDRSYSRLTNPLCIYTGALLSKAQGLSEPYLERFQGPIHQVDTLGCRSLDLLETRFPILKRPTEDVFALGRQTYQVYKNTMCHTVSRPLSAVSTRAQAGVLTLANKADSVVDTWLPDSATGESAGEVPSAEPSARVVEVTQKVRTRLTRRLSQHFPQAQPYLEHPVESVASLALASRQNLVTVGDKLRDQLQTAKQYSQHPRQFQEKVYDLSHRLLHEAEHVSVMLQSHVNRLPTPVQGPVQQAIDFTSVRYQRIKDEVGKANVSAMDRASAVLRISTEGVPILDHVVDVLLNYTSRPTSPRSSPVHQPATHSTEPVTAS